MWDAGFRKVEAAFDAGELGRTAADIDHGALFKVLVEFCAQITKMCLLFVGENADALPDALFDCGCCLVRIGAVSQYGSCENVNAIAIEVRSAAQVRVDGFNGALYAFLGHSALFDVRGEACHHLVVQQGVDILLPQGLVRGAGHLVDAESDGV